MTCLAPIDAVGRKRYRDVAGAMDSSKDSPATREKRIRADGLHLAVVANKKIVKEHAQSPGPEMRSHWDVSHASAVGGGDAAISALTTGGRNRDLGHALSGAGGEVAWKFGLRCKGPEPAASEKFEVSTAVEEDAPLNDTVDDRPESRRLAVGGWAAGWAIHGSRRLGDHPESGGRQVGCEGSLGGYRKPRPGSAGRFSGNVGARQSPFLPFSGPPFGLS